MWNIQRFLTSLTLQNEVPVKVGARFPQNQRLQKCIPKTSQNTSQNQGKIIKIIVKMRYQKVYKKNHRKKFPKVSPGAPQTLPKSSQIPARSLDRPSQNSPQKLVSPWFLKFLILFFRKQVSLGIFENILTNLKNPKGAFVFRKNHDC